MIAYGVSFAPIAKSSSMPIFGTTGRPAASLAPSIHGEWMYGSLSWHVAQPMPTLVPMWIPLHRFDDFSLSAGCGTWPPSVFEYSAFWKKQVFPVNGLCPIMAMSLYVSDDNPPIDLRHSRTQREPCSLVRVATRGPCSHSE